MNESRGIVLAALLAAGVAHSQEPFETAIGAYELADTVEAKIDALKALSKVDAPAADLTRELALGLADEDAGVRAAAIRLVAAAPDRDAALDALLQACKDRGRRLAQMAEEFRKARSLLASGDLRIQRPDGSPKSAKEFQDGAQKVIDGTGMMLAAGKDAMVTFEPLCEAMLGIRDDRAIEGVAILLGQAGCGEAGIRLAEALFEAGTRPAVIAACDHLQVYEARQKHRRKILAKAKRARREPESVFWTGTSSDWNVREGFRLRGLVLKAREAVADSEAATDAYAERLREFAAATGLAGAPSGSRASIWHSWGCRQRTLPESVRGTDGSP